MTNFGTVLQLTCVKEPPRPIQMMNLVIRSSVTPLSKSCWGVMSLWGPLVSLTPTETRTQRHQSSEWLKWSWLLSEGAPLCWFLLRELGGKSPRSRRMPRERARNRESAGCGCTLRGQWTPNLQLTQPVLSETTLWSRDAAHTLTCQRGMGSVTFDPAIQTPVNTIYYHRFVRDCVIICFPPSDLNAVMSRRFFSFCCCIAYIVHLMSKVCFFQEVEQDSFPSPVRQ